MSVDNNTDNSKQQGFIDQFIRRSTQVSVFLRSGIQLRGIVDEWLSPLGLDEFESRTEAQAVLATLTDMHNKAVISLESKQYCPFLGYDGVNAFAAEVDAAVAWSEGYMAGVNLHEGDWLLLGGTEVEKLLAPIIVLAANDKTESNLSKLAYVTLLSDAAINIYHFWHNQGSKTLRTSIIDNGYTLH